MRFRSLAGLCSLSTLAIATAAAAQDSAPVNAAAAPAAEAAPAADAGGLGEIVVTASKRSENLQRAALSITAIGSQELQSRGITDAAQLQNLAPAVQIQSSFLVLTYIRGVGNYSSNPTVDQSVAFNVDGVYIDRTYGIPSQLFDLERVELLRGPQGTLQGRNSTGGSINLVTAKPTFDFSARGSLTVGNYSTVVAEGAVNLPISDKAALRLSGSSTTHDGYFRNGFGDANAQGVRARLRLQPTERLDMIISADYSRRDEKGSSASICPPGSAQAACVGVAWRPFDGTPGQGRDPVISMDEENLLRTKNIGVYADVNYDLDFATLTWNPNYRWHRFTDVQSYSHDFSYAPATRDTFVSQELRLASKPGSPITWVGGLYWGRQSDAEQQYYLTASGPFISVSRPGFRTVGHVSYKNDVNRYIYRSQSVFAQVSVPLFDGFRVVAGGRYTDDRKSLRGNAGIVFPGPTLVATDVSGRQSSKRFTYKAGVEYDIAPQVLGYANVSTGFKAGGVNDIPPGFIYSQSFAPEKNTGYQAGIKSRFFDNRLQLNAEGFYYDYRGYQSSFLALTNQGILISVNVNSQKARMYGGEAELSFVATPNDRIDLSASVLNAKHIRFDIPAANVNLDGARMQNAPKFTLNGVYAHTFDMANGGNVVARGEVHHESSQYTDYRLSPGSLAAAYWRENFDITYNEPERRWSLTAFVRNVSNNGTYVVANAGVGPYEYAVPLNPRTYGVRAGVNF